MLGKKEQVERGRYGLYCIYDIVGRVISPVMQFKTLGAAQRQFKKYCESTGMAQDYQLWRIGFLDIEYPENDDIDAKTRLVNIFEVVALGTEFNFDVQLDLSDSYKTFNSYERG